MNPQTHLLFYLAESQGADKLAPYQDRLASMLDDGLDDMRGYTILDWFVREYTPIWYDVAGHREQAKGIRSLPRVVNLDTIKAAEDFVFAAKASLPTQWTTPRHPTWVTAWRAAWHRAGSPAWSTAWASVGATVGTVEPSRSERSRAWTSIWFSTWAVAQNAAWSDAQYFQRMRAYNSGLLSSSSLWFAPKKDADDAAWRSILSVAKGALAPAVEEAHSSSLDLLDRIL